MHVGEPALAAVVVVRKPLVIEPDEVEDGAMPAVDARHILHGLAAAE